MDSSPSPGCLCKQARCFGPYLLRIFFFALDVYMTRRNGNRFYGILLLFLLYFRRALVPLFKFLAFINLRRLLPPCTKPSGLLLDPPVFILPYRLSSLRALKLFGLVLFNICSCSYLTLEALYPRGQHSLIG